MKTERLPFTVDVTIQEYRPPRRLWHIPDVGTNICPYCGIKIDRNQPSIQAGNHDWHKECFRCSLCRKPMDINSYSQKDDLIFHHDCRLECYANRCAKCTELVEDDEGVMVQDRIYHRNCLSCDKCQKPISSTSQILTIFDMIYCSTCYDELIKTLPKCVSCRHPILPQEKSISFFWQGIKYFAHDPECSKCIHCGKNYKERDLLVAEDKVCCQNCYQEALHKICAECNEPIFDQTSKLENLYWHPKCFQCSICKTKLNTNTCVFNYGILKCRSCAMEDRPICRGCGRPIQEEPLQALRAAWHRDCLVCQFCEENVINKPFQNVEGFPCCNECFQEKIASGEIDKKTGKLRKSRKKGGEYHSHKSHR